VGDEGGFAPNIKDERDGLNLLTKAIEETGYTNKVKIAMDVAASEFWDEEKKIYDLSKKWTEGKRWLTPDDMIDLYTHLVQEFNIFSIEDPFYEGDFETWQKFQAKLGDKIQIVGDDLLVTNPSRINMALNPPACNALLLKLNQIGSLEESIYACNLAQNNNWKVMVSHRSGETEDHFIADLSVGLRAGQIKSGAPCRGERTAKYNRLLRIEEYLGEKAEYAGLSLSKKQK
jgi:enolase